MKYDFITTYSSFVKNETLKSYDIVITKEKIDTELSLMNYNFDLNKNDGVLELKLNSFFSVDLLKIKFDHINSLFIDRFGWFPSMMVLENRHGKKNKLSYNQEYLFSNQKYLETITIIFEPKSDKIENHKNIMYHLSIQEYVENVIKNGLVPKSKSKLSKHLDRIYLCDDISNCYKLIPKMKVDYMMKKSKNLKNEINDKYIIYEVNLKDLDIDVHNDPNYIHGFFVVDNINPKRLIIKDTEK